MWFFGCTNKQPPRTKLMIHTRSLSLSLLFAHFGGNVLESCVGRTLVLNVIRSRKIASNQSIFRHLNPVHSVWWARVAVLLHFDKSVHATDRQSQKAITRFSTPSHCTRISAKPSTWWQAKETEITESSMKSRASRKPTDDGWPFFVAQIYYRRYSTAQWFVSQLTRSRSLAQFARSNSFTSSVTLASAARNRTRWKFEINGFVGEST